MNNRQSHAYRQTISYLVIFRSNYFFYLPPSADFLLQTELQTTVHCNRATIAKHTTEITSYKTAEEIDRDHPEDIYVILIIATIIIIAIIIIITTTNVAQWDILLETATHNWSTTKK